MKKKFLVELIAISAMSFLLPLAVHAQCVCSSLSNVTQNWATSYGGSYDDVAYDIIPVDDGDADIIKDDGYVVVGSKSDGVHDDAYVIRITSTGSSTATWTRTFDAIGHDDVAYAVCQTHDNYILVCGKSQNNQRLGYASTDMWVVKLNIANGTTASGWSPYTGIDGFLYGSHGSLIADVDIGYDIEEDQNYDYVIVGQAGSTNDDVTGTTEGDGDAWILQIDASGSVLNDAVFNDPNVSYNGNDYARNVLVDCNTGDYIVSGFTKSYDPAHSGHSQLFYWRSPDNFGSAPTHAEHGYNGSNWDYGSFNMIQLHPTNFGRCEPYDGFLSLGVQHPLSAGCFGTQHDLWAEKVDDVLVDDNNFVTSCIDADVGGGYGGKKADNGQCAVEACDGYLLCGYTYSSKNANGQSGCGACEVSCNHYTCAATPTSDVWLVMVDKTYGTFSWDDLFGDSGEDGGYSIKRVYDGSYIIAGFGSSPISDNHGGTDFWVINFELNACNAPTNLSITNPINCDLYFDWDGNGSEGCDPHYEVQYKINNVTQTPVFTTSSSMTLNSASAASYSFCVRALCSPNKMSGWSCTTNPFVLGGGCKLGDNASIQSTELLSVYPNPSDGTFQIELNLPDAITELTSVELLDQVGRGINSFPTQIDNGVISKQISLTELPQGFYWIRVSAANKMYQKQIVVQKD